MHLDIGIKGVTGDSRKVMPGFAFVAIRGEREDGNDYVEEAVARGASIVYTEERKGFLPVNVPVIRVEDSRALLAGLSAEFYGFPSQKLNTIGVTGTNGKTTTCCMIEQIFQRAGCSTGLISTVMIKSDDKYYFHDLTTPDSEYLQRCLADMADRNVRVAVIEVSSHGLKFRRVDAINFNAAVHTNITLDHMDAHNGFDEYVSAKKRLFNMLSPGSIAVVNTDDPYGLELIRDNPKLMILTYGLGAKASITASSIDVRDFGIGYTCCLQRAFTDIKGGTVVPQEIPITLTVPGKHNVYNSLAAVAVGLFYGIGPDVIIDALKGFGGVWRRMQSLYYKDYMVIDDFSHNPGSYEAAFETVQSMNYCSLHIVNAIRGGRGEEINRANAAVICNWANILNVKEITVTGSRDVTMEKDRVTDEEKKTFMDELKKANVNILYYDMLEAAINNALNSVGKGDIILLLGAQGMNRGQDFLRVHCDAINPS